MTVLLADHDSFSQAIYVKKFERSTFDVVLADSGDTCMRKAKSHRPDAIVMELALPRMNGFRVLELLKSWEETANIPVVLLTSLAEQSDIDRCGRLGCRAFFIKPHTRPECVVEAVKELVA